MFCIGVIHLLRRKGVREYQRMLLIGNIKYISSCIKLHTLIKQQTCSYTIISLLLFLHHYVLFFSSIILEMCLFYIN